MDGVGQVCLLPRIEEADYAAFRTVLVDGGSGTALPASYDDWLMLIATRRRARRAGGDLVRDIPISILHFSAFCERSGIARPTTHTLDRYIVELAHLRSRTSIGPLAGQSAFEPEAAL